MKYLQQIQPKNPIHIFDQHNSNNYSIQIKITTLSIVLINNKNSKFKSLSCILWTS